MVLNTKTIVERITERMDVDRIFMAEYDFLNVTRNHLLIVMNPISGISPKIMAPIVELCLIDQPDVSFEIVLFGDWKNKLSTGSVFYAYLSLPEHRLFASERKSSKDLTIKELQSIVTLFEQVRKRLESQSDGFKEGSQQFVE